MTPSEIWGNEHPTEKEFRETRGNSLIICAITLGKTPIQKPFQNWGMTEKIYIYIYIYSLIRRPNFYRTTKRRSLKGELTLRRLMSYIYIYIYIYMEHPFLMFLDHTQRRSTVGRTPLDE